VVLKQDERGLFFRAVFADADTGKSSMTTSKEKGGEEKKDKDDTQELIHDYFNLDTDLESLYRAWSSADINFRKKASAFAGIRMLRQDPWENVISFICSTNNNIPRITKMVGALCARWGDRIVCGDGQLEQEFFTFPDPCLLVCDGVEEELRALGFGYRAKFVVQAARIVVFERPSGWLDGLRRVEYQQAREALMTLPGVGPKVADCVCLMSLDKAEAVPVDTHGLWFSFPFVSFPGLLFFFFFGKDVGAKVLINTMACWLG
jgi:N-glycosylase/DNA lyase